MVHKIIPPATIEADLLGDRIHPLRPRIPTIPSEAEALEMVKEMGEFDQLRLRQRELTRAKTVKPGRR